MMGKLSAMRSVCVLLFVSAGLMTPGCAHSPVPMRVRYADIGKGGMTGFTGAQPLIIEFQPGERIPLNFEITGDGFELQPQHPQLELVATQRCFVRIDRKGLRLSADPDHFDDKPKQPGSFRVGLWVDREQHAKVDVVIATPRH
jgi:hypothetical protein